MLSVAEISSLYNWRKAILQSRRFPYCCSPLPESNSDVALDTTFAWSQIAGFPYRVQIALDSNFATMVDDTSIAAEHHVACLGSSLSSVHRILLARCDDERGRRRPVFPCINVYNR